METGSNKKKAGSLCAAAESDVLACASNSQDELYVPDSEEEEADIETEEVAEGAATVKVVAVHSPAAAVARGVGPTVVVAAHGPPATEASINSDPSMELAPEVQARLKVVLAGKDSRYHDFFISLYKARGIEGKRNRRQRVVKDHDTLQLVVC
ncbi:unnamed protein product [Urochloa humidicola]